MTSDLILHIGHAKGKADHNGYSCGDQQRGTEDEVISMTDEILKKVSENERLHIERISREKWKFDQAVRQI